MLGVFYPSCRDVCALCLCVCACMHITKHFSLKTGMLILVSGSLLCSHDTQSVNMGLLQIAKYYNGLQQILCVTSKVFILFAAGDMGIQKLGFFISFLFVLSIY